MSRKGRGCDNASTEGFFGLFKQEVFHGGDWSGIGAGELASIPDQRMRWFRSGRIFQMLGVLMPDEHRFDLKQYGADARKCPQSRPGQVQKI